MLIKINAQNPQSRLVTQVAEILMRGGIIAYPTDTYYGIGCDIMNKKAIEHIYRLKKRDQSKPFSFICSDLKNISDYAKVTNYAYKTMRRLLPGPYTFILEGSKLVPKIMLTKRKTAGIRVPDHPLVQAMLEALGEPIMSSTLSLPGDTMPLTDPVDIEERIGHQVDVIVDAGPTGIEPTTVLDLTGGSIEVLRRGRGDVSGLV